MRFAIASRNFIDVSGHAGQARRWLLFETDQEQNISPPTKLEIPKDQTFHHHKSSVPKPFQQVSVVIAKSAGEGFSKRLQRLGITVVLTSEQNPNQAIRDYIENSVKPPAPRPIASIFCKIRDHFSSESH